MKYRPGERDFSPRKYLKKAKHRALFESMTLKQLFSLYELVGEFDETDNSATSQQLVDLIEEYVILYTKKVTKFGRMMLGSKLVSVRKALTFFVLAVAQADEGDALHIFRALMKDGDLQVRQYARRQVYDQLNEARMGASQYPLQLIPDLRQSEVDDGTAPSTP